MAIQRTYWEGNPEDRNYADDLWSWLMDQSQVVWLNLARTANWDQFDRLFVRMVRHPDCDRALASWLFWRSGPAFFIDEARLPPADDLLSAILDRASTGGWEAKGLHYQRAEVALDALRAAEVIQKDANPPFRIPRELCASFDGENPTVPTFDGRTEAGLAELFAYFDGDFVRDEAEIFRRERQGGNRWYEKALRLPAKPVTTASMSDAEAIDAVFGEHRSALDRIETARKSASSSLPTAPAVNPDRKQRLIGFGFLGLSAALLLWVVWRWISG